MTFSAYAWLAVGVPAGNTDSEGLLGEKELLILRSKCCPEILPVKGHWVRTLHSAFLSLQESGHTPLERELA